MSTMISATSANSPAPKGAQKAGDEDPGAAVGERSGDIRGDLQALDANPGRVRESFKIDLPRPRDINSQSLAGYATEITRALKAHRDSSGEVSE